MQWVDKKLLPIFVIVIPVVIGIATALFPQHISSENAPPPVLSCFDESTLTVRVTLESTCQAPLLSLGNQPLHQIVNSAGVLDQIHPLLQARFSAAQAVAAAEGIHLYISSGFRSYERQGELFEAAIKKYGSETEAAKWVLPPHYSHHPQGLALDVNYPGDPQGAKWLEGHGALFGLCRVYANEWWHFEGVISPGGNCPAMAENALIDMPDTGSIS